jgi:CheY-like chemotaxis protein
VTGTVLVVEDEEDGRVLLRLALRNVGHTILEACDGEEALAVLSEHAVDLVLLDLRLPRLDGWGVIERLRSNGRLPGLTIVMVSAFADKDNARRALELGCARYITKPFNLDELRATVGGLIADRSG